MLQRLCANLEARKDRLLEAHRDLLQATLAAQRLSSGRVLFYNVFEGRPLRELGEFLQQNDYDVVGLAECNGWHESPKLLTEHCVRWGYKYGKLLEVPTRYHIAVISKVPFDVIEHNEKDESNLTDEHIPTSLKKKLGSRVFWHGLLHIVLRAAGRRLHVMITHLIPFLVAPRLRECAKIAEIATQFENEPLLLLGDFNNLSPHDADVHAAENTASVLAQTEKTTKKFLKRDRKSIDYTPVQTLLDAHLTDVYASCRADEPIHTAPTSANKDPAHACPLRLDHVYANKSFLDTWPNTTSRIIRGPAVEILSDHYPVEVHWGGLIR